MSKGSKTCWPTHRSNDDISGFAGKPCPNLCSEINWSDRPFRWILCRFFNRSFFSIGLISLLKFLYEYIWIHCTVLLGKWVSSHHSSSWKIRNNSISWACYCWHDAPDLNLKSALESTMQFTDITGKCISWWYLHVRQEKVGLPL